MGEGKSYSHTRTGSESWLRHFPADRLYGSPWPHLQRDMITLAFRLSVRIKALNFKKPSKCLPPLRESGRDTKRVGVGQRGKKRERESICILNVRHCSMHRVSMN